MKTATGIAAMVLSASCLAGEPQAMVYLAIPFGQLPQFGVMLRSTDATRPIPVLDFRLSYRPKAEGDASAAADAAAATNWWVIGGVVAAGAVLIQQGRKSQNSRNDDHVCPAINPPPPNC